MSHFAKKLLELRKEKEFTQKDLAFLLKTNQSTISEWEKGNNIPTLRMTVRIAKLFDVSYAELIEPQIKDILEKTA